MYLKAAYRAAWSSFSRNDLYIFTGGHKVHDIGQGEGAAQQRRVVAHRPFPAGDRAVLDDFHKLYQFLPGQVGDTGGSGVSVSRANVSRSVQLQYSANSTSVWTLP